MWRGGGGEGSGNYMNWFIFVNVSTSTLIIFHSFQGQFVQICIYMQRDRKT